MLTGIGQASKGSLLNEQGASINIYLPDQAIHHCSKKSLPLKRGRTNQIPLTIKPYPMKI
jgi:hypothetical protein